MWYGDSGQRECGDAVLQLAIVIEKEPEGEGYSAYGPSLPGCFSNGRTIEETRRNMRDAILQHVASLLAHGEPVPPNAWLVQDYS